MGQIADDMVDGLTCSHCGQFFSDEHGYPVLCWECFDEETPAERAGLQRAIYPLIDADDDGSNDPPELRELAGFAPSKRKHGGRDKNRRRAYRQRRAARKRAEREAKSEANKSNGAA